MFSISNFIGTISQYAVAGVSILAAGLFAGTAGAAEFPPSPWYFQTNSPNNDIANGDWYSASTAQGGGAGSNFITIHVPVEWPATEPVKIQLLSPEWRNQGNPASGWDENDAADTYFELFDAGTDFDVKVPSVINGTSLHNQTYTPVMNDSTPIDWVDYYTLSAPVTPGSYLLAVKTLGASDNSDNSQNGYKVRVGRDSDMVSDPDGTPGSGDELALGTPGVTVQHSESSNQTIVLYRPVGYMQPDIRFHNFDMEGDGSSRSVGYYAPFTDAFVEGELSGNALWNNGGTISDRMGDSVPSGPSGYWRVEFYVNNNNQFNLESLATQPMLGVPPNVPVLALTKNDGLAGAHTLPGEQVQYTITFENISTPATNGSKAYNVQIVDEIPAGTTFVSAAIDPATTVAAQVNYDSASNSVIVTLDDPLDMLAGGAVNITVELDDNYSLTSLDNWTTASYLDTLMFDHGTDTNKVTPVNLPPTAIDHNHTVTRGETVTIPAPDGLLVGSNDPNGDTVTVAIVGTPTEGVVVSFDPDTGEFTYTADPLFVGTATFTYTVTDGELVSEPATVTITIEDTEEPIVTGGGYVGPRELLITFSQEMSCGVLDAVNYTITGPGQGTLHYQPDEVIQVPGTNTYRLIWNDGSTGLAAGQPVTIIVNQANVCDTDNNPLDTPNTTTVLVPGAPVGPFPCVCPTTP